MTFLPPSAFISTLSLPFSLRLLINDYSCNGRASLPLPWHWPPWSSPFLRDTFLAGVLSVTLHGDVFAVLSFSLRIYLLQFFFLSVYSIYATALKVGFVLLWLMKCLQAHVLQIYGTFLHVSFIHKIHFPNVSGVASIWFLTTSNVAAFISAAAKQRR